jgi:hypothetical protein
MGAVAHVVIIIIIVCAVTKVGMDNLIVVQHI